MATKLNLKDLQSTLKTINDRLINTGLIITIEKSSKYGYSLRLDGTINNKPVYFYTNMLEHQKIRELNLFLVGMFQMSELLNMQPLQKVFSGLTDIEGNKIYFGDKIIFSNTEGWIYNKTVSYSSEYHSLMIGNMTYAQIKNSGFYQTNRPGYDFDFLISNDENLRKFPQQKIIGEI